MYSWRSYSGILLVVLYIFHWIYKSNVQGRFEAFDILIMLGLPLIVLILSIFVLINTREKNGMAIFALVMICVMFTRFGQMLAYLEFTIY